MPLVTSRGPETGVVCLQQSAFTLTIIWLASQLLFRNLCVISIYRFFQSNSTSSPETYETNNYHHARACKDGPKCRPVPCHELSLLVWCPRMLRNGCGDNSRDRQSEGISKLGDLVEHRSSQRLFISRQRIRY